MKNVDRLKNGEYMADSPKNGFKLTACRLKILFFHSFFGASMGGAERIILQLSKFFISQGHRVSIATFWGKEARALIDDPKVGIHNLRMQLPLPSSPQFGRYKFLERLLRGIWSFTIFELCTWLPAHFFLSRQRSDVIFVFFGPDVVPARLGTLGRRTRLISVLVDASFASLVLSKLAHSVAAVSRYAAAQANRHGVSCTDVPLGVDTLRFNPGLDGNIFRKQIGIAEGSSVVLTLTKLNPGKGLTNILSAFRKAVSDPRLSDVNLVVAGVGPLLSELKDQAQNLGLEGKVLFTGFVEDDDLPLLYSICDVFVLTPEHHAWGPGFVYLEAMACGKCVIASKVDGVPEIVIEGMNGRLVDHSDVIRLADALKEILLDKQVRYQLGSWGRQFVEENHSLEISSKAFEHLLYPR